MEKGLSLSQVVLLALLFLIIFIAGAASFWFYQEKLANKSQVTPTPQTLQPSPTSQSLPTIEPTITTPPILTTQPDSEGIKETMAKKHNKSLADVEIVISKIDSTHAWGSVKFAGEIGGGWFLAYKNPDGWIIVDDGNGTISCEIIAPYNFPSNMVSECVDKNGNLIKK